MQSRDELPECICWANMVKLFVGSRGTMQMFDSVLNLQLNLLVDTVKGNFNRLPLGTIHKVRTHRGGGGEGSQKRT